MAQSTNTQFAVAVHLLTLLAGNPGAMVGSDVLAVSPATSPVHVRRILGHLREAGLVRSQPGSRGGWMLAKQPERIDLAEVWRGIHGDDPVLGLHIPDPGCPVGRRVQRNLRAIDRRALAVMLAELGRTTVADVLADVQRTGEPTVGSRHA